MDKNKYLLVVEFADASRSIYSVVAPNGHAAAEHWLAATKSGTVERIDVAEYASGIGNGLAIGSTTSYLVYREPTLVPWVPAA